jgi:hypothetical protein
MSVDDEITTWLEGIGLAQYATVFAENAVDLDILPDVTEADLERLGVALGDRKRMLRAIAALSGASSPPAASAPATGPLLQALGFDKALAFKLAPTFSSTTRNTLRMSIHPRSAGA